MFLRADLRFPCFPLARLFPALQRCQGAPLLGAGVFVFPESGAPTGGSSPGQLQMRNSWPAALAAAQIRPFEKITVLLPPPPPPVGHARSAEGRGMCRRAEGGREGGRARGTHFIRPLSESFSHYFSSLSLSPLQMFQFSCTGQAEDCRQIKPHGGFSTRAESHMTLEPTSPSFGSLRPTHASALNRCGPFAVSAGCALNLHAVFCGFPLIGVTSSDSHWEWMLLP